MSRMHEDTKRLIRNIFILLITSIGLWVLSFKIPHLMAHHPNEDHAEHSSEAATVDSHSEKTETKSAAELKAEHEIHVGLYKTMVTFLAISSSAAFGIGIFILFFTLTSFEKARETIVETGGH